MRRSVIAILFPVAASTAPSQSDDDVPIQVSTFLAIVPVIVSDRSGKHVAGIKP